MIRPARPATAPTAPVQGEVLWRSLGFKNERAFQRARQQGWAELPLYPVPGRSRGVYARQDELAAFLEARRAREMGREDGMP